jgi:hypothetical protein
VNAARELLTRVESLGVKVALSAKGKLRVSPPGVLSEELKEELRRHKPEILALLAFPAWPCPACGGQVRLEAQDQYAPTRFWTCPRCGTWGATRDGAAGPAVWVTNSPMQ